MANIAIGWKGFVTVEGNPLPYTRQSVAARHQSLRDEGIHGGAVAGTDAKYFSEILAGLGPIFYSGDIETYMFGAGDVYTDAIKSLIDHAIEGGAGAKRDGYTSNGDIVVNPGTTQSYQYPGSGGGGANPIARAVVEGFSLRGAAEAFVTFRATIRSTTRSAGGSAPPVGDYVYEANTTTSDYNPLPYHACTPAFTITGGDTGLSTGAIITAWELNVTNNPFNIVTFCGSRDVYEIGMGIMEVTGNFTYFGPAGAFVDPDTLAHGGSLALGLTAFTINCPFLQLGERGIEGVDRNAFVPRTVNFRGLSDGSQASIYI